jgi:cytochrome c peroxidase
MIHRALLPAALVCSAAMGLLACEEPKQGAAPDKSTAAPASAAPATTPAAARVLPPMPKAAPLPATPAALPELKVPEDNALTAEKVALGKQLFFDKRLSKDGSASCETCHLPEKGWTDAKALSTKVGGAVNTRHTPTLWNVGYNDLYYWDGRAPTLEKQIEAAWKGQMGAEPGDIAKAIGKIPGYEVQFKTIFGAEATADSILKALASFVRTLRSGGSPWDKYEAGDKAAVGKEAVRGFELFRNKAGCAACHAPPLYTDNGFHNVGIGFDKPEPDLGRGKTTKDEKDIGAFKTPTLRSVETSGPYFHDGRAGTVEDAVDYMLSGGISDKNPQLDKRMKKVKLSAAERSDLLAFVKALKAPDETFERPTLPQ